VNRREAMYAGSGGFSWLSLPGNDDENW